MATRDLDLAKGSELESDPAVELVEVAELREVVREAVREIVVTERVYSGPMPPPEVLKGYGDLVPNAPARIFDQFERDSEHVRAMAKAALEAHKADTRRVQWMAFALIASGYGLGVWFALQGHLTLAGITISGALGGTLVALLRTTERTPLDVIRAISDRTGAPSRTQQAQRTREESNGGELGG